MVRILIIDDSSVKAGKITEVIDSIPSCSYELASDLVSARRLLQQYFDLLVLDMNLPERFNELPKENKGFEFIKEIKSSNRLRLPGQIIGLSEFPDIVQKFKKDFENNMFSLIQYDNKSIDWQEKLTEKVSHLVQSEFQRISDDAYKYDVAFITALRVPEFEAVLNLGYQWQKLRIPNDPSNYHIGKVKNSNGETLNVVATYLPQMGMVATATAAMKIIGTFKPKFLIMTGICGGIKDKVQLGDIVISDLSFDFGSGKVINDEAGVEKFEPDFKSIPLAGEYKEELIELTTRKDVLRSIKDSWNGNSTSGELSLHLGPVGSGAGVISNSNYVDKIRAFQRKMLALDMETYAVFYCCEFANSPKPIAISIKAVSDFADSQKNDSIQKYCSYTSANLADYIIKHILQFHNR